MNHSILTFRPEDNPFDTIYVDVTHRCQMSCANCYLPNRQLPDMDNERFFDLLKKLPQKTNIRLVGGEPTLRSDLCDIIQEISNRGHRPMLITNALKLADYDYCLSLKESGLTYAQISLNGFNDDSIYKVIDNMNCAEEKIQAIKNCNDLGIGISISSIIIRDLNSHLVGEIINYAKTLKTPVRVNFRNVGDLGRNMAREINNYSFTEMVDLVAKHVGMDHSHILEYLSPSQHQLRFPLKIGSKRSEVIWIKLTDWQNYPKNIENVSDIQKYSIKGRVTQDFELSPFFEHVKLNEFGY